MRIFELHFNPRAKKVPQKRDPARLASRAKRARGKEKAEKIFDSFCYTPENIYEKRLGSLYMVGELQNLLPQNFQLLNNLSQVIKGKFYSASLQTSEKAFEEGLKKANEFLTEEVSKENVSWLGNLNFATIALSPRQFSNKSKELSKNWWEINFTKVGSLKILLLKNNQIIDIGKNLDLEEIEPYPLKIFTNTVSGKLSFGDKIIILTKEVFSVFAKGYSEAVATRQQTSKSGGFSILNEFSKVESFDERKIKEILKLKEKEISEISGVLLLIDTGHEFTEKPKVVVFQKELEKFSLKEVFTPLIKTFLRFCFLIKKFSSNILSNFEPSEKQGSRRRRGSYFERKFHLPKIILKRKMKSKLSFNLLNLRLGIRFTENLKRNLVLVLVFFLFMTAGFFIFKEAEKKQLKEKEEILSGIQEKISQAENFFIFKNKEKAKILFKEAWEVVLPLTRDEDSLKNKAISLKNSIEINLKNLSKLEVISEPELVFEFDPKEFIPQKMVYFDGNLYFFSPFSEKLSKINLQNKNQDFYSFPFGKNEEASLAAVSDNAILFFSKPGKITFFKEDGFGESFFLKLPYSDFNFVGLSSYQRNIYFLDKEKGEIIKYLWPLNNGKESPQFWLNPQTKKATDSKSMAIDGSIWILNENNTISRYHNNQYQADLIFDIFPFPKRFYKILTLSHLSYLYILEPIQNRIIILEKTGEIFKQFQVKKFENLKDFTISEDGKTIYLLNHQAVYQINL